MKRNVRARSSHGDKQKKRERQRSMGRRNIMWHDSVIISRPPRIWKHALIVWLLPSVASFSSPAKVVPIKSTSCSSEASMGYKSRTTALSLAWKVEEVLRNDLEEGVTDEASVNITGMEDGVVLTQYPENNGIKNGVPERNGVAQQKNVMTEPSSIDEMHEEFWKRRHARSIQEGIRRETTTQLSSLLNKAKNFAGAGDSSATPGYAARTISGLIHALAEEADDLEVEVDAQQDTPLWDKQVDAVRIHFSRLEFKPLRISGLDRALRKLETSLEKGHTLELATVCCPDEAFDKIDVDNSGALDSEELARALNVAAAIDYDKELVEDLASQLVELYDFNGDGVVDRGEYQSMVEDMAALRQEKKEREEERNPSGWRGKMLNAVRNVGKEPTEEESTPQDATELPEDPELMDSLSKGEGSIVLSGLKLDLRRLLFGALPVVKKITPGGPLILEPFTMTISGSFNADDVMNSFLLDAGLRRLVARVLRRRIFFRLRDFQDGALFYGRNWKLTSDSAPSVEVPKLEKVEFDKRDRMIVTGRALVRTSPDAPSIEQAFKVRCKIGTRADGRVIRLLEPELALVIECPKAWERNIVGTCQKLDVPVPTRPEPIYSFFPIYSPFKVDDNDGFDLGEDNCIKSIAIKDGALRFEMSAVMKPGRFLDNHYLAFTFPNRTFIITMDRVREGIRAARRNKKARKELQERQAKVAFHHAVAQSLSSNSDLQFKEPQKRNGVSLTRKDGSATTPAKSFFSRFVEGYLGSKETKEEEHDFRTEQVTAAISDWFGRQGGSSQDGDAQG